MKSPFELKKIVSLHRGGGWSWNVAVFDGGVLAAFCITSCDLRPLNSADEAYEDMNKSLKNLKLSNYRLI